MSGSTRQRVKCTQTTPIPDLRFGCLGAVAATTLLATHQPVGRLRGRFHEYEGMRVIVTYHPAYLLRNPPAKREVWKDMKLLMSEMGIDIPDETDR